MTGNLRRDFSGLDVTGSDKPGGRPGSRPGLSLVIVLTVCLIATTVAAAVFLLLEWSHESTLMERRRFMERAELASLASEGCRWLQSELDSGHSFSTGGLNMPAPKKFTEVRILNSLKGNGYVLDIYNLDYDPGNVANGDWLRTSGEESFFPPKPGAFLIRCFRADATEDGTRIMLETVVTLRGDSPGQLEPRPLLRQEIWL